MRCITILAILVVALSTQAVPQERPWRSATILFADDHSVEADIAFRSAMRSEREGAVESGALTDTLWLFTVPPGTEGELIAAPSGQLFLLLFVYEPQGAFDEAGRLGLERRIWIVNTRHDLAWPTFHSLQEVPERTQFTTGVVARLDDGSMRTYRFDEFFSAPYPEVPGSSRIVAIRFKE